GRVLGALGAALPAAAAAVIVAPKKVACQVGAPQCDDFAAAGQINDAIPEKLRQSAYMDDRAPALVLALALDADDALRKRQLADVEELLGEATASTAAVLHPQLAQIHPMQRLPLAQIAFPTL